MRKLVHVFLLMLLAGHAVSQNNKQEVYVIADVSVAEFKHLMDSLEGEVVVDLRTPEELQQQGKIPGAIEIDYFGDRFEPSIQALDTNKVYLLYCAAGGRSGETAELMKSMGFKKVYNLKDGFKGWVKQKMPVSQKQ